MMVTSFAFASETGLSDFGFGNAIVASAATTEDGFEYSENDDGTVTITGYSGSDRDVVIPGTINGKTVIAIDAQAFYICGGIKSINIPDSVTSIGDSAFYNCISLTSVTFGENSQLETIASYAFYGCTSLTSITIPDNVTTIEENAFCDCTSLASITIQDGVTTIADSAFSHCTSLESITIPDSVTTIGYFAFYNCTSLTSIFLPTTATIEDGAIPTTATMIKYNVADETVTITEITLGTDQTSVAIPETIGGKSVSFADGVLKNCPDVPHTHREKTAVTCTENAVCGICEKEIPDSAPGHDHSGDWQKNNDEHWKVCARNNCDEIIDKAIHTENSGTVKLEPTETTEGTRTFSCSVCGAFIREESIPALTPSQNPDTAKVAAPSFAVKGVFGGRNVTFNCTTPGATIYYTTENRSVLKLTDPHVDSGDTVLFTAYYGTMYARAYYDGKWSNVSRLILKIPKVNTPTITKLSNGKYKIKTTTPGTIVYYTIDGTTPSATNYKGKFWTSHDVSIPAGKTIKAIAVRNCFSDSEVVTAKS